MLLVVFGPRLLNQLGNVLKIASEVLNRETLWISECGNACQVRLHGFDEHQF